MAEKVTRQFADVPSGAPVIGGLFRLVNLTDPADLPHEMLEATDPLYPGRYYTADGDDLSPGVYRVERNQGAGYVTTGEEVSVSPHRVYAGDISVENTSVTQLGLVVGDTVRASAFVPEGTPAGTPLLQYLQEAVNYASGAGLRKIYVGAWRGRDRWEGASQLDLTAIESVDLDLGGAEIARSGGATPIAACGGVIHNGRLQGTGGAAPVISVLSKDYTVTCREIEFTGTNAGASVQSGGDWARCNFRDCSGHIIWPDAPWGSMIGVSMTNGRFQESNTPCAMVGGAPYYPIDGCNTPGYDVGSFFGSALREEGFSGPDAADAPFSSGDAAARALKNLWFEQKPKWGRAVLLDRLAFPVFGKVAMTPTAVFSRHNTGGQDDISASVYWHKDGAAITDSENGATSAIPFRLKSGIVINKAYRGGDAKYERVDISAHLFFSPVSISAMTYDWVDWDKFIGWLPKKFVIDTSNLSDFLKDKDGSSIAFPAHVIDVRAFVTQQTGSVPESATFCGNAAMTGAYIQVDLGPAGIPIFEETPPQLRRLSGQELPVPSGLENFIGVKLDISFINPARTDLPRIL